MKLGPTNTVTHNAIENPLSYQGKTLAWQNGRQLTGLTGEGLSASYTYNDSGIRNLQGDITGILNSAGEQIVSYTYDSWGRLLSTSGSAAETIGQKNPFRYRGYYYDAESGWYYLNSRYYDPEVGRFLNADGYVTTSIEILDSNMFAYCKNNPVNLSDPSGDLAVGAQ